MAEYTIKRGNTVEQIYEAITYGTTQADEIEEYFGISEIHEFLDGELSERTIRDTINEKLLRDGRVDQHEVSKNGGAKHVFSTTSEPSVEEIETTVRQEVIETVETLRHRLLRDPTLAEIRTELDVVLDQDVLTTILYGIDDTDGVERWRPPSDHRIQQARFRLKNVIKQAIRLKYNWHLSHILEDLSVPRDVQGDVEDVVQAWWEHNKEVVEQFEAEIVARECGRSRRVKLMVPKALENELPSPWYIDVPAVPG